MQYRTLGRSGLRVSPIALGTMNFGPVTAESDAHVIMDAAFDHGVNLFDTADVYGADANRTIADHSPAKGLTEEIIGRWLGARPGRRDRIVLISKAYGRMGEGPNDMYLSAGHLRRACEASLRRLNTDHLDVFMLHHVDRATGWAELWEVLTDLRREGKIRYAGTSNFAGWQLAQGQEAARARQLFGLVAEESIYNLMERTVELEVLPACRAYGIGLLPYSPLNSGLLGGILAKERTAARSASARAIDHLARRREQIRDFETLCAELGSPAAVVAQAWLCHQEGVTAPIVGARTLSHLEDGVAAARLTLSPSELTALDSIFPGPGPAPEAYAW
ncbi:aldo/keto reductase [Embleya scabrispora]|uniref:aldo/keto reductase n=1 Tax=Embleya scabrispora TaxID=159449 RepID=UPI00035E6B19|nr:aldo/keto reductase [Embleya scabrispora]MYS84607.1 aldo/keto reductase [Streptomyces sp. SID5474]